MRRQLRLAVVDDEDQILKICGTYFDREGYDVTIFSSGEDLLQALSVGYRPHAVILDVLMPGKSGFDICRSIKTNKLYKSTKVIIFTALSQEAVQHQAELSGADACITKGADLTHMTSMISSMVG